MSWKGRRVSAAARGVAESLVAYQSLLARRGSSVAEDQGRAFNTGTGITANFGRGSEGAREERWVPESSVREHIIWRAHWAYFERRFGRRALHITAKGFTHR